MTGASANSRGSIVERARKLTSRALTAWRRSVQVRVVTAVVVLSTLVVGTVGWLVMQQITDGLVKSRVDTAVRAANSETASARERLASAGISSLDSNTQARQFAESLVARGNERNFGVEVLGPVSNGGADDVGVRSTRGLELNSIPQRLRRTVEADRKTGWTYTTIRYRNGTPVPGVAVGSTVVMPTDGAGYAVYYLFSMGEEQRTLELLRRSLLTSGALMILLVGGVAWLVTRQVINPIRLVRRTAERIASGRLEERMQVTGEDDIARLSVSFNQMASALQEQIRQLVELSRVQRTFVSDVSHELRTPLTTVRMAAEILHDARGDFDPVTARSAELLQHELDRFEALLADLLEISRFDAGAAVLDVEERDLVEIAEAVVASTTPFADARGLKLGIAVPAENRRYVAEVDARRIERVLRNLVTNAIDHAEPERAPLNADGDAVLVTVAADHRAAAITVRDNGVGLQPGQSAMVFNRFWRADPARARTTGGTGLGLAIALEDARLHGGWLQVWGAPDRGCNFRLTVPLVAAEPLTHSPLSLVPADHQGVSA